MSDLVTTVSLSGNRLLKNRMKRVPSAILVDRSWYDLSLSSARYSRRAALAGFAALGLGGVLALDGTLGWPGSRRALAWALSPSGPQPWASRLPLVLHEGLFAMASFSSTVHGGLNAAYRAHAALDAALATAVGHWQGHQSEEAARQRLMAYRDDARHAEQQLAGYLAPFEELHDTGAFPAVTAAGDALSAHDQDIRNNIIDVAVLLSDEVGVDIRNRLVGLHFSMRSNAINRQSELVQVISSLIQPKSPERAFLDSMAATVELQLALIRLMPLSTGPADDALVDMVEQLEALLLSRPDRLQALQSALGTSDTLRRLASELAAESGLALTASDVEGLAATYMTTGRAVLDVQNVGLHFQADLRMMACQGNVDAAALLKRAIEANRELNEALAHRSAAAKARFDWLMDLAGSRTV
jgi:hypothetical protein